MRIEMMGIRTSRIAIVALFASCVWMAAAVAVTEPVRQLTWEDLMPRDWNPETMLEEALNGKAPAELMDSSSEAQRLLMAYMSIVSDAPVVEELDGQNVRLAGFVVPLEFGGSEVTEFLLVPYFGACIHVPPPPANQIVYVKIDKAYPITGMFDAVQVTGTLKAKQFKNLLGDAGYTIVVSKIEPYQ